MFKMAERKFLLFIEAYGRFRPGRDYSGGRSGGGSRNKMSKQEWKENQLRKDDMLRDKVSSGFFLSYWGEQIGRKQKHLIASFVRIIRIFTYGQDIYASLAFWLRQYVQTMSKMKSQKSVTKMISKTANCWSGCSENYNFL